MCKSLNKTNALTKKPSLRPREIIGQLRDLIEQSTVDQPELAKKLSRVYSWIYKKKEGLLTRKKYVLSFLTELVVDSELYLKLQRVQPSVKDKVLARMTSVEIYWYEELFPAWLSREHDPNYNIWTQKLMAEKYSPKDEETLACIAEAVKRLRGSCLWKYILDLSMANDLLIASNTGTPLCIQITTMSNNNLERSGKKEQWELSCRDWGISTGVFVILDPTKLCREVDNVARNLLEYTDDIRGQTFIYYDQSES
ncbi:hypothetical protein [Crocosphaera sp.]|uniref:hypothetical protein n=1 Tax=Crocosphaera sp. TaxID=2729996 RepID=UPI003F230263|nr:hypothetical protein [Crocosphaera sp.]